MISQAEEASRATAKIALATPAARPGANRRARGWASRSTVRTADGSAFPDPQVSGAGFSGTVFSGTVFSGTVFSGTVFSGTVFSGTVSSGTVSSGTVCSDMGHLTQLHDLVGGGAQGGAVADHDHDPPLVGQSAQPCGE
ncbi:hypothetical protein E3T32_03155 [Cryobacterium sp. TMT2-23]|nr:hypothetical protein E3T32_03155 [Cryobacterium sp. TMT2-23]